MTGTHFREVADDKYQIAKFDHRSVAERLVMTYDKEIWTLALEESDTDGDTYDWREIGEIASFNPAGGVTEGE